MVGQDSCSSVSVKDVYDHRATLESRRKAICWQSTTIISVRISKGLNEAGYRRVKASKQNDASILGLRVTSLSKKKNYRTTTFIREHMGGLCDLESCPQGRHNRTETLEHPTPRLTPIRPQRKTSPNQSTYVFRRKDNFIHKP